MRRISFCSFLLIVCTTAATAQVKISQIYGGGANQAAPLTRDYIELYNTTAAPVLMTNWSVQYASATGTFNTTNTVVLNGTIPPNGYWLVGMANGSTQTTALNAPGIPAVDSFHATGNPDMSATVGKVALRMSSAAITTALGQPTTALVPDLIDFVGYGTTANWNEPSTSGAPQTTANGAPAPSATVAVYRNDCGAADAGFNKDDWAQGAPSPRNSLTAANLGLTLIGSVFPFIARDGDSVSLRCSPRLCASSTLNPGTTVTVDLFAFGGVPTLMHDDGLGGDDVAGDGLYMLTVVVPPLQASGSYQLPVFATDGVSSGGAYLGLGVVSAASTPANDNCTTASPLAVPSSLAVLMTGANVESNPIGTSATAPTTGFAARRGLWYTVTGTGNTMTASTCTAPIVDSILIVLCGTCDGLSEVVSSDDAGTTLCPAGSLASVASWCSLPGVTYYIFLAPFSGGAQTSTINLSVSDDGTPCATAMPCTTCPLVAPVLQTETEAAYGTATNDGCDSSPGLFTTVVAPGFPGTTYNGTAKGMGGNRDTDWYRFQATLSDTLSAVVTGQAQGFQLSIVNLNGPGGTCPSTTVISSSLSTRCGSASVAAPVIAGNWYAVRVITVGIEGNPPAAMFGGGVPSGGSHNYSLTVAVGGPPPNDNCASAQAVALTSTTVGNTNALTTNDGTASCDPSGPLGLDVWYTVTTTAVSTNLHIDTCGSAADTTVAVFSGTCASLTEIACNDDASGCVCSAPASYLDVPGLPAAIYRIRVSTKAAPGAFTLNVRPIVNDACCGAIPIVCNTTIAGSTIATGADVVPVAPAGPIEEFGGNKTAQNGVWYTITPATSGTITADTLSTSPSVDTKIFAYTGSCGALTAIVGNDDVSSTAPTTFMSKVAFLANAGQQYWLMVCPFSLNSAINFTLAVRCDSTPSNDDCVSPTVLSPAEGGSIGGTTIGATAPPATSTTAYPSCHVAGSIYEVWYSYTACASTNLVLNTCGAHDTEVSVHTACPALTGPNSQVTGACNDQGPTGCTPGSQLTVAVTSGTTYLIRVVSKGGINPGGAWTLTWAAAGPLWYADADGDGFGNPASSVVACLQPPTYVGNNLDCNDNNIAINPNAVEICDGIDNDCDTFIDDADPNVTGQSTWYQDSDNDTYGNAAAPILACFQPSGYVANSQDCDDNNINVNPAATEVCNGIDDDCDNLTDDADPGVVGQPTWYQDNDGDTYGNAAVTALACSQPPGYVANSTDCNDNNAAVNPGATEICNNIDDDCDSIIDEVCPTNDHCTTATAIVDGSVAGDNSVAGSEVTDLSCGPVLNDVWYSYTNTNACTWTVTASLCVTDGGGAAFDAVLHVFSPPCGALTLLACANNTCGTEPRVTFSLAAGATALIAVSAAAPGPGGIFQMVVSHGSAAMSQVGPGCSDGGGPGPTLTLSGLPILCAPRTLDITGAAPSAAGMMMFSFPATPTILSGNCPLYLDGASMTFLFFIGTDAGGNWQAPIIVPCDPALECGTFTVQGFLFPNAPPPFYQVTSGLSVTLGF
jgi:Lamin Tail Domain/Putative metal-binding motif